MIEAIAKIGELEIEELHKQGENESKYFVENMNFKEGDKLVIKKESELIKGTPEYKTSLVLDTLLNIERNKQK